VDKYSRSNFYKKEIVTTIEESDLLTNSIDTFLFKRPSTFHTVTQEELLRPDLISFSEYGKISLWWIILKINDIQDPFNDLEAGQTLVIPNKLDIEEYQMQNRRKNRT